MVPPNHPMFNRVFHYKPSILVGKIPYFLETSIWCFSKTPKNGWNPHVTHAICGHRTLGVPESRIFRAIQMLGNAGNGAVPAEQVLKVLKVEKWKIFGRSSLDEHFISSIPCTFYEIFQNHAIDRSNPAQIDMIET